MRILVTGGRNYSDRERLFGELDRLHATQPVTALIHGAAKGADALAAEWARSRGVLINSYPANWGDISHPDAVIKYTRSGRPYDARAGFRRNRFMLERGRPDLVVAFPGGSGTVHMKRCAQAAKLRIQCVSKADTA